MSYLTGHIFGMNVVPNVLGKDSSYMNFCSVDGIHL